MLGLKIQKNFAFTYPSPRNLREIVQLSLFERESKEKCAELWNSYHIERRHLSSLALDKQQYNTLTEKLTISPIFIWPVKRKDGHFMLMSQYQKKSILYTYLEDYKKDGTHAKPYYILTIFDELVKKKELALLRGDIMDFKLQKSEAQWLLHNLVNFYINPGNYDKFIHNFNHNQGHFNYDEFKRSFDVN